MIRRKIRALALMAAAATLAAHAASPNVQSALSTYVDQAASGGSLPPSQITPPSATAAAMTPALKTEINAAVDDAIKAELGSQDFRKQLDAAVRQALKAASPGYIREARAAATHVIRHAIPIIREGIEHELRTPAKPARAENTAQATLFYSVDVPLHSVHSQEHLIANIAKLGFNDYLASTEHGRPIVYIGRYPTIKRARRARKKLSSLYSGRIGIIASDGKQIVP